MRVGASLFYLGLGRLEEEVARCYIEYWGRDRSCSMEKYTVYSEEKDFPARQCVPEIESVSSRPLKGGDIATRLSYGKVGNRKVWQSGKSRKTLSGTRGRANEWASWHTCIQILEKYPGYPAGVERAGNTFSESSCCRCRCNFKGVCCDVRGRERENRPRSLFPALPAKISRQTSRERVCIFYRGPEM